MPISSVRAVWVLRRSLGIRSASSQCSTIAPLNRSSTRKLISRLRRRRTGILLLPLPFFLEGGFPFRHVCLVPLWVDEWIRFACFSLLVLGFHPEICPMRPQKKIARQSFEYLEGLDVILRDLWILLVSHQHISRIYVGAADDHGVQRSGDLMNLHGPCRAALCVAGRQVRRQSGASKFDRVPIVQDAI